MPSKEQESSSILSVRLAEALLQRLDRSLDWWETTRRVKSSRNAVRLLLDSRVVIGQFLCNSLFLQAFYEGRDRCCIFRKNRLISSPYLLSMMCRTLESSKSLLQYHAHHPRDKRLVQPRICHPTGREPSGFLSATLRSRSNRSKAC